MSKTAARIIGTGFAAAPAKDRSESFGGVLIFSHHTV